MIKKCEFCNTTFEPTNSIQRFCKVCAIKRKKAYNLNHYYLNQKRYIKNNKQWIKDNPDKAKIIRDRSYKNNPNIYKKCSNEYRKTHKNEIIEWNKQYVKGRTLNDPNYVAKRRQYCRTRRAKLQITQIEPVNYYELYLESPFCFYCGKSLNFKKTQIDHYVPVSKGGAHIKFNMRVSCAPCNRHKSDIMPEDFYNSDYYKNNLIGSVK